MLLRDPRRPLRSLRLAPPPKTPGGGWLPMDHGSAKGIELASARRPLTRLGSHLPQKPLGEVDFDPASTNISPRPLGCPSPDPSPFVPHGEGEFDPAPTVGLGSNLPRQFRGRWAGGAGPEGACAGLSEAPDPPPTPPLPRSWGRGRPPLRGPSKRPVGGEGPAGRAALAPRPASFTSSPAPASAPRTGRGPRGASRPRRSAGRSASRGAC
jgi:hypothetical protein